MQTSPCDCANDSIPRHNSSPVPLSASAHLPSSAARRRRRRRRREPSHDSPLPLPLNPRKLSRLSGGGNKGHRVTLQSHPALTNSEQRCRQPGLLVTLSAGTALRSPVGLPLQLSLSPRWDPGGTEVGCRSAAERLRKSRDPTTTARPLPSDTEPVAQCSKY